MAESFFENHPLEEYFQQSGDVPHCLMPGRSLAFPEYHESTDAPNDYMDCFQVSSIVQPLIDALVASLASRRPGREFAERFKYDVISSSLLATSLSPSTPSHLESQPPSELGDDRTMRSTHILMQIPFLSTTFLLFAILLLTFDYYLCAVLALAGRQTIQSLRTSLITEQAPQMFSSLKALTDAAHAWDTVISEVMSNFDVQERSPFYSPATRSSLRITFQSTLDTSQTQCDSIRPLFCPLTSPLELSMLSEMYAPPSPGTQTGTHTRESPRSRAGSVFSPPVSPTRVRSPEVAEKRATWSGASPGIRRTLSHQRSPLSNSLRGESSLRRRSARKLSISTPASPSELSSTLHDVNQSFGVTALNFQRSRAGTSRRPKGLSANYNAGARSPPPSRSLLPDSPATVPSPSRFTSLRLSRSNPSLSTASLRQHLETALASRRYCASHLLALRFDDEDNDEVYWEDVRSIMMLLTSTLEDAGSRLRGAFYDFHTQSDNGFLSPIPSPLPPSPLLPAPVLHNASAFPFAPMPTDLSKFITHMNAVSIALDAAKLRLQDCLSSIQAADHDLLLLDQPDMADHPAFQAFDGLRVDLGLALRECERGRTPLQELLERKTPTPQEGDPPPLPRHQAWSPEETEQQLARRLSLDSEASSITSSNRHRADTPADDAGIDDVTAHLLLTSSAQHLPPPGLEQVYEAMSSEPAFERARSKLSREERIRIVKEDRENGQQRRSLQITGDVGGGYSEVWGPGGDVVQELKDVITLVGERRRKLVERILTDEPLCANVEEWSPNVSTIKPPKPMRPLPAPPSYS